MDLKDFFLQRFNSKQHGSFIKVVFEAGDSIGGKFLALSAATSNFLHDTTYGFPSIASSDAWVQSKN